jgi:hypothetical protein
MANDAQSSILNPPAALRFPRRPGETPRAFSAFMAFFQLGHARSHQAVAETLGESLGTVRNWSSRFNWAERLQDYNSGLLEQQAHLQAENKLNHVADWNRRLEECRELEWDASQKLVAAARCFLESFGDEDLRRMTLSRFPVPCASPSPSPAPQSTEPTHPHRPTPLCPPSSSSCSPVSTASTASLVLSRFNPQPTTIPPPWLLRPLRPRQRRRCRRRRTRINHQRLRTLSLRILTTNPSHA